MVIAHQLVAALARYFLPAGLQAQVRLWPSPAQPPAQPPHRLPQAWPVPLSGPRVQAPNRQLLPLTLLASFSKCLSLSDSLGIYCSLSRLGWGTPAR